MKVAFDENVPIGMVRVFQSLAKERQIRRLVPGITVESAADYTPKKGDADYVSGNDVPWLERFAAAGGKVVISGDVNMRREAHERYALRQLGFVTIFFEPAWSQWDFFRKCALLLNWWPAMAKAVKAAQPGTFWAIPLNWKDDGELRPVMHETQSLTRTNPEATPRPTVVRKPPTRPTRKGPRKSPAQGEFEV